MALKFADSELAIAPSKVSSSTVGRHGVRHVAEYILVGVGIEGLENR